MKVINSLRATLKLALAEMDVRTQKVQDAKKDVVEAQANVATDEKYVASGTGILVVHAYISLRGRHL